MGIQAEIIDGFSYRFPFSISTDSDQIDLNSLTAESICNCVQVRFDKGSLSKNTVASGEIFLRPKSGQLVEGVKIRGFRRDGLNQKAGEGDNVVLIFALKVKVICPVELSDRHLLVEDGKLQKKEVKLKVAEGVTIKSLSGSCTDSDLQLVTDSKFSELTLKETMPLTEGHIFLDFELENQGVIGKFSRQIVYGERLKTRIVPSVLLFDKRQDKPQQKCLLVGPELLAGNVADLALDVLIRQPKGFKWESGLIKPELATKDLINADKAILTLTIEEKVGLEKFDTWTIRIVDRNHPELFVDIDCKWRESSP
ncbi:MAG: hypothetical protein NTY15_04435 [Planctomycetota bacterium]|nr:hypothetical protein [Planctomycetota bacterium]